MLADPVPLQSAQGDTSYSLISTLGSKTVRKRTDTAIDVSTSGNTYSGLLTVSHDSNAKSGRTRSVLRIDTTFMNFALTGDISEDVVTAYLVIDRKTIDNIGNQAYHLKSAIAQLVSFFSTDPTAPTPSSVPLGLTTSNAVKFLGFEP